MKVGLYCADVTETVGGGFVVRDGVASAAMRIPGKHHIEPVGQRPQMARFGPRRIARGLSRLAHSGRGAGALNAKRLHDEVRQKGVDLLWFNYSSPLDVDLPYMVSVLDVEYRLYPWFPELSANGEWEIREREMSRAVRQASIVIAGSDTVRDQIHNFYGVPIARIAVVPFPTPQAAIDAAADAGNKAASEESRIRAKYMLNGPFLFYPAQFWAHKNHINLLRAFRLLRERHGLPLSLVLTGSDHGNFAHVRNAVSALGLDEVVRLPGFVPREDVIAFYRAALALTFVSFHGPENLPVLEAQALGCAAVLSDIPGVRALYGEGPILVDPRDENSIAYGIKRLNEDPDFRARRIAIGRKTALSYTYEKYIGQIHHLLDDFEPIRRCWP